MDGAAQLGRNPVSKHQIQPEYGDEQADVGRDCRTRLARPNSQARTGIGKIFIFFPAKLTTSRIGNLTRLIHTLLYVMTIHTYIAIDTYIKALTIHTYIYTRSRISLARFFDSTVQYSRTVIIYRSIYCHHINLSPGRPQSFRYQRRPVDDYMTT